MHRPMFSAVSLEGIINSKKFEKIQNLVRLALFVQGIMCAKIEVIWRWSKKCPHSGGTIWSNLSQFLKKVNFSTTSKSPQFSCTWWHTCAKHVYERNFWKKLFYNARLRHRPMFSAVSLEGIINSIKLKQNTKPWKPSIVCARDHVCQNWGDLEVVEKIPAFRRDYLV